MAENLRGPCITKLYKLYGYGLCKGFSHPQYSLIRLRISAFLVPQTFGDCMVGVSEFMNRNLAHLRLFP